MSLVLNSLFPIPHVDEHKEESNLSNLKLEHLNSTVRIALNFLILWYL